MSHILDALRRAESERRLGRPPDRGMIAGPLRAARRRRRSSLAPLPVILAGILLLIGLLLAREWLAKRAPTEAAPETKAAQEVMLPRPALRPDPAPEASRAPLPAPEAAAERELPRAQLAEAARIEDMDALFASEPSPPPHSERGPATPSTLNPRDALADRGDSARPAGAGSEDEAPEDLPSARSAGMPDFIIQVHAWAPEPEQRFLRVDGRRYREGDRLPNAARVEAITRDGVTLLWSGQRVKRGLDR